MCSEKPQSGETSEPDLHVQILSSLSMSENQLLNVVELPTSEGPESLASQVCGKFSFQAGTFAGARQPRSTLM